MNAFIVKYATMAEGIKEGPEFDTLYKALSHAQMVCDEPWVALNPWVIEKFPKGVHFMHVTEELIDITDWDEFFNKELKTDREKMERIIYYNSCEPYAVTCKCGKHYTLAEASFDDHMAYCHETKTIAKKDLIFDKDKNVLCRINTCDCGSPVDVYIHTSEETMIDLFPEDLEQ